MPRSIAFFFSTSLVTGVIAGRASLSLLNLHRFGFFGAVPFFNQSLIRNFHHFGAVLTDTPHQALSTDKVNRSRNQKWLDAHVHQTRDGLGGTEPFLVATSV